MALTFRAAIGVLAKEVEAQEVAERPYDQVRDLIDSVQAAQSTFPNGPERPFAVSWLAALY